MIRVSVIVPCRNAETTLGPCLQHLVHELAGISAEVIVVCNGCDDSSVSIARQHPVTVVELNEASRAKARNAGAKAARGEVIAFVDADNYVDKDFFKHLLAPFSSSAVVGVEAASVPTGEGWADRLRREWRCALTKDTFLCLRMDSPAHPLVNTSACAYRKSAFEAVDGFNASLDELEDADLSRRISLRGGALYGAPEARSSDIVVGGLYQFFRRGFKHGKSLYRYQCLWNERGRPSVPYEYGLTIGIYHAFMLLGWFVESLSSERLSPYSFPCKKCAFVMMPNRFEAMVWSSRRRYVWTDQAALDWWKSFEDGGEEFVEMALQKLEAKRER